MGFRLGHGVPTVGLWVAAVVGGLVLGVAGCGSSGAAPGSTGVFGGGGSQVGGSCGEAVAARFGACGLSSDGASCPSACEGQCLVQASCAELQELFAVGGVQGSLVACVAACGSSISGGGCAIQGEECDTASECCSGVCFDGACNPASVATGSGGGSSSSEGSGGGGGGGGDGSGGGSSGTSGSGGLMHPECADIASAICDCGAVNVCGTGDCYSCAASLCDDSYAECSAELECLATCSGDCPEC